MKRFYGLITLFVTMGCVISSSKDNVSSSDTIPEVLSPNTACDIHVAVMEQFDGWKLDSIACIENMESAMRLRIKGKGMTDIVQREMFVRTIDVAIDSMPESVWSYVVLSAIKKDQPFEAEALYIPTAGTIFVYDAVADTPKKDKKTDIILISKQDMKLRMIHCNDTIALTLPMATGKNPGHKTQSGDKKTPEGIFTVYAIHDATEWDYDFNDGRGKIKGTYGKYFVRFKEHYHIGIHGTHLPETLGTRATDGCIRLHNDDIERIVPMISRSKTLIVVTPAKEDLAT
ncbi:MAG: L,D-transpeptidase, partial [Tannerella sp.]|nr:L,D-transpeptidase [Tannerella sp.]